MSNSHRFAPDPLHLRLAHAIGGHRESLVQLLEDPSCHRAVVEHRLASALYLRSLEEGLEPPADWHHAYLFGAAQRLLLERSLARAGQVLDQAKILWLPIKGLDLGRRIYVAAEERLTSDVDLLVPMEDYRRARELLCANGWSGLVADPRMDRYLVEEGYAWQALDADRVPLELHLRLWGFLPAGFASALIEASSTTSQGLTAEPGLRAPLAWAFVLASVHAWLDPAPRKLSNWRDLERLENAGEIACPRMEIVDLARRFGLALPVALAAAQTDALWPRPRLASICEELMTDLRALERQLFQRAVRHGTDSVSTARMSLVRLAAGRPSRSRWRPIVRRFWAHPGIVAAETPDSWIWPRRRLGHLLSSCGFVAIRESAFGPGSSGSNSSPGESRSTTTTESDPSTRRTEA